jgi:Tol biopolymer transport system component
MKLRRKIVGLSIATTVGVVWVAIGPSGATPPGTNGLVIYQAGVDSRTALFTIRPDGTARKRFVTARGEAAPDWSPDGNKVVFAQEHPSGPLFCSIMLMSSDGTGLTDLSGNQTGCEGEPSFTPDGRRIVFGHYDDKKDLTNIWTMDLTGGDRHQLTTRKDPSIRTIQISPDGRWITFAREKSEKLRALFRMRSDGSAVRQLTPFTWDVFASKHDWSPDGKLIVLTRNADFAQPGKSANLVTIHPDGSGAKYLTHFRGGATNAFAGSFAPDGKQIVFRLQKGDKYAIAVVRRDGRNLRQLTRLSRDAPRYLDWGTHQ